MCQTASPGSVTQQVQPPYKLPLNNDRRINWSSLFCSNMKNVINGGQHEKEINICAPPPQLKSTLFSR